MRRLLPALAALLALLAPVAASAHPLGNFTVNQFTLVQPSGDRVYVLHVLDLAEIPTFEDRGELEAQGRAAYAAGLAARVARGLTLTADGRDLELEPLEHAIDFPAGAAGLPTTRLELVLVSEPLPPGRAVEIRLRNEGFPDRIGWREIVLEPAAGAEVSTSSVPQRSLSDGLRTYPDDLLQSPPDVREAVASVTPGEAVGAPPRIGDGGGGAPAAGVPGGGEEGFASLVTHRDLSLGVVLVSLAVAMFWGAAHALGPGHGKAIVAAFLVGTKGTYRQALWLGLIVTVTHTIGVFALGLVTLALSELIVPADLYPWINLAAALLVLGVGVGTLRSRLRSWRNGRAHGPHRPHTGQGHDDAHGQDHAHHHAHGGNHDHGHDHAHAPGWRGLLGVGISGGLLPCPSALVVLLAAISLHRVGYGLVLILAFSVGLAATISGIGLVAVSARGVFRRWTGEGRALRLLPALSALVILAFGIVMTARALPALG